MPTIEQYVDRITASRWLACARRASAVIRPTWSDNFATEPYQETAVRAGALIIFAMTGPATDPHALTDPQILAWIIEHGRDGVGPALQAQGIDTTTPPMDVALPREDSPAYWADPVRGCWALMVQHADYSWMSDQAYEDSTFLPQPLFGHGFAGFSSLLEKAVAAQPA